jgi:hypothetical protein
MNVVVLTDFAFNYAKTFFIANSLEQFDKSIAYISR